jgi:hypothetical protein
MVVLSRYSQPSSESPTAAALVRVNATRAIRPHPPQLLLVSGMPDSVAQFAPPLGERIADESP